ncbi:B-type cyclin [Pelomyxa schiedti]|nr:B-type cyclin [Pelomyxa schiedti]
MFLLSPRNSNEVQCNNPQCPPSPTIIALSDLLNRARLVPPSPPPAPPPVIIIACGFAYLPKELHWLIFMNLPVADLCRCARVCRSWQQWIDQILILPDMWFHYQYIIALKKELVWCKSNGNYFVVQTALTEKMRAILLEWMFEVSENLHLGEQSAFTAMCLLDQFLARTTEQVPPSKLQLFGATSLLTASKAVSTFEPTLGLASKVTFMSAGTFTHPELLQAEKKVLSTLNYRLLAPSPSMFLEMFLELPQLQPVVSTTNFTKLTKFYLEVSTLNFSLQLLKPSILSAAVIILSAHTLGKSIWFKLNEYIPLFTRKELKEIAFCMTRLHEHILFIQAQTTFTSTLHKFEPISSLTPILPPFD